MTAFAMRHPSRQMARQAQAESSKTRVSPGLSAQQGNPIDRSSIQPLRLSPALRAGAARQHGGAGSAGRHLRAQSAPNA